MPSSPPSSIHLDLKESDVIKMTLEFLQNRDLHISQLSLERETGVINAHYSDDLLFLRQLILDGQWEDVLEFVQPLEGLEGFQTDSIEDSTEDTLLKTIREELLWSCQRKAQWKAQHNRAIRWAFHWAFSWAFHWAFRRAFQEGTAKKFKFIILKHKFVELLCIKGEVGGGLSHVEEAMEEVVSVLRQIEAVAASKEEYSALCLLLTAPRLTEHAEFRDWNPSKARVSCFRAVLPLVERFLALEPRKGSLSQSEIARNDRLMQLVIKGMLYEACVEFCQAKATKSSSGKAMFFTRPLSPQSLSDADLSLISWLQALPAEHFTIPFEPKALNVDVERLERPFLETSWTEHILVTPIKPAQVFPHSAMPYSRPKSADLMTRSLNLYRSLTTAAPPAALGGATPASVAEMTRSLASFHLTGRRSMDTSVDRLFEQATPTTGLTPIPETPAKDQPAPQPKKSPPAANGGTPNGPPHPRPSTTGGNQDLLREFQRQKRSSEAPNGQPLVSVITPCGTTRGVSPSSVSTMSHSANANSQHQPPTPKQFVRAWPVASGRRIARDLILGGILQIGMVML
ncbi:unnamed protein product [Cyprideis torosa]|uniref:CTLH domain-containing protein n=1 Tax=Cyprideis torosa TaxID=163714 RepID=A0A7R8W7F7_9CRUS|nr:unnamed protein product [Cyprideis torosa]CAG0882118.1 unnamed protein product [Cyprideis torosa]